MICSIDLALVPLAERRGAAAVEVRASSTRRRIWRSSPSSGRPEDEAVAHVHAGAVAEVREHQARDARGDELLEAVAQLADVAGHEGRLPLAAAGQEEAGTGRCRARPGPGGRWRAPGPGRRPGWAAPATRGPGTRGRRTAAPRGPAWWKSKSSTPSPPWVRIMSATCALRVAEGRDLHAVDSTPRGAAPVRAASHPRTPPAAISATRTWAWANVRVDSSQRQKASAKSAIAVPRGGDPEAGRAPSPAAAGRGAPSSRPSRRSRGG